MPEAKFNLKDTKRIGRVVREVEQRRPDPSVVTVRNRAVGGEPFQTFIVRVKENTLIPGANGSLGVTPDPPLPGTVASWRYVCETLTGDPISARVDADGLYDQNAALEDTADAPMQPAYKRPAASSVVRAPDMSHAVAFYNQNGDFELVIVNEVPETSVCT